jgi:hypothetical protein
MLYVLGCGTTAPAPHFTAGPSPHDSGAALVPDPHDTADPPRHDSGASLDADPEAYESGVKRMMERADASMKPMDLRRAVVPLRERYPTNCVVPTKELPPQILRLSPKPDPFAFVTQNESEHRWELNVLWGGGFGHWGVIVSPPGDKLDPKVHARLYPWGEGVVFFVEK